MLSKNTLTIAPKVSFLSVSATLFSLFLQSFAVAQPWADVGTPINQVFSYKDDTVLDIRGTVVKQVKEDEFLVRDRSGEIIVDVERERHFGVAVGQEITIRGEVDIGLFREKILKAVDVFIGDTTETTSSGPAKRTDLPPIRSVYLSAKGAAAA